MSSMPPMPRFGHEVRRTLVLSAPLVLGQLSSVLMTFIDTVLAGRHGPTTLASVAVGSAVWSVVILVLIGVLMAVPPSVSQLDGAGRRDAVGPLYRQALWLAAALGVALFGLVSLSGLLLAAMGIADDVRPGAEAFLMGIRWGAPALALFFASRYLSEGLAWTMPTMVAGLAGVVALLPLGWAMLFGYGPVLGVTIPPLGAAGLGYATAIVLWAQALGLLAYLWHARRFADLGLFAGFEPPHPGQIGTLLKLGLPIGVAVFMEGSLFVATALLIGRMGTTAVAAHQVAINVASLAFMIPLGVAMATTVRIGQAAGRGDGAGVRAAGRAGYAIVLVTQVLTATVLVFGGAAIASIYTDDATVAALAATLMLFAAAFQFPDGIQALSAGALRGLKDTTWPMAITTLAYWGFGMPLGAWLALEAGRGWGPQGMWVGLIGGLSMAATLLAWRFLGLSGTLPTAVPPTRAISAAAASDEVAAAVGRNEPGRSDQ
jgi:multidrug resistance protein, MATE family